MNAPAQGSGVTDHGAGTTAFAVLIGLSVSHLLNDTIQSLLPAIYPLIKQSFALNYGQIGLITFTFQLTASLFQPFIGIYTDRHPQPYSLPIGMGFSFFGLLLLSMAPTYGVILLAAGLVGTGSSVLHPESSRLARLASGGRHGLAQSIFQVGGNVGASLGPLLAAAVVVPYGRTSIAWLSILALIAIAVLWMVSTWYRQNHFDATRRPRAMAPPMRRPDISHVRVVLSLVVLGALVFSKFFYLESFRSYYLFYLIDRYHLPIPVGQVLLFVFLFSFAAGTLIGGPLGDRFGRKYVIWASILGILPFTLVLPHVGLVGTVILTVPIGIGLASAFPAIIVYAQELVPGRTGMVSGIFFGLAFGLAAVGAATLGALADRTSIEFVYQVCAFLPAIGLITIFLPNIEGLSRKAKHR